MTATARQRSWPSLVILTLLWLAISGPGLFTPPLMDDVDASHADARHEIITRHEWVTLHENGIRYPLLGHAVGIKLFAHDAWSQPAGVSFSRTDRKFGILRRTSAESATIHHASS